MVVTATGTATGHVWLQAFARALTVAAPVGAGIYALSRTPFRRFGALLVLAGFVWFLTTLANSDDELVYGVGRIAGWLVEPLLLYLLLSFPTGRLERGVDRALVGTMAVLILVLYLPTALMIERYLVPGPWMSCTSACPDNPFMLTDSQPAFVDGVMRPLRDLLALALFVAVAVRLALRVRGATRLVRRTMTPVFVVACVRCVVYGAGILVRRHAQTGLLIDVWTWALAFMVPLMSLAFLTGLVRWWAFIGSSTRRLAARIGSHPAPEDLRTALAEAFDDPSLEIVYWLDDGRWADAAGNPCAAPAETPGRCVTEIADGGRRTAAIVHDRALQQDRAFVDTATAYASMMLDNQRLSAQAASLLREVETSRARIRDAAADERRRIERDLHDGAQQRLIALGINLGIAAERTGDGEHTAAVMRRLATEVEQALEELRSLTHGLPPAALGQRGLVAALRAAAARNLLTTTVFAVGVGRHSPEVENAAYFCCMEAMQNAIKHAHGASAIVIDLSEDGARLRLEVRDDGTGFDPAHVIPGAGLSNLHERLAAAGGELTIVSSPGHGTRILAGIPLCGNAPGSSVRDEPATTA